MKLKLALSRRVINYVMDNSIACMYTSGMYVYCEQVDGSYKAVGCMDSHDNTSMTPLIE